MDISKYEHILDDYLAGKLSGQKLNEFEKLMEANAEIQKEYLLRKELSTVYSAIETDDLRSRIQTISSELESDQDQTPSKGNSSIKFILLALAVLLLSYLAYTFLAPSESVSKNYYAEYYSAKALEISNRSGDNDKIMQLQSAYNSKEYGQASTLLSDLIETDPDMRWQLYRGITFLETEELQKAIADFQTVQNSNSMLLRDQARWFQAMAYFKVGNQNAARNNLLKLANDPEADFHLQAKKILSELD